jgi:NAD(P)-dependent dehydrogenase (short-subunit alcohol dehydrogenase family)
VTGELKRLQGKVAVVTGATSGIGRATCSRLSAEGASVVFCGRRVDEGAALERELGSSSQFVRADVTSESDVVTLLDAARSRFGRVDVLFNNAGGPAPIGEIATIASGDFDAAIALILRSVFYGLKHAAPIMKAQQAGAIISNASVAAHLGGYASSHIYSACKAAVVALSRSVALELAPHSVTVNTVSPGAIATGIFAKGMGLDAEAASESVPAVERLLAHAQPMPRAGRPEDVAATVAFLASADATFITGRDFVIDGGLTAGRRSNEVAAGQAAMRRVIEKK